MVMNQSVKGGYSKGEFLTYLRHLFAYDDAEAGGNHLFLSRLARMMHKYWGNRPGSVFQLQTDEVVVIQGRDGLAL